MVLKVTHRRISIVLLLCVSLNLPRAVAQSYSTKLPLTARVILKRRFPGWRFSEVSPEVKQYVREYLKGVSPVLIKGDFDGDRRRDYAILIRRGRVVNAEERAIGVGNFLVIFLRRSKGYRMHVIKEPGGEYIVLAKKGSRGYNYETDKKITYTNDAIIAIYFEKGGLSYEYKRGRFFSFVSID